MKIEVITNEDGDAYGAVGEKRLTRLGALRAINKELDGWGLLEEVKIKVDDLMPCEFWKTTGGEHDGWNWWSEPHKKDYDFEKKEYLGWGWIYKVY